MSEAVDMVAALGGELVAYIPHGGVEVQFRVVVERQPSQVAAGAAGTYPVNTLEVLIPRDAVDGVLTVQARKDRMRFKKSMGDAQETDFIVQKLVDEDVGLAGSGGMFRVMVSA